MTYKTAAHFASNCDAKVLELLKSSPRFTPRYTIYLGVAGSRDEIIAYLCENDRNGCYSDEDHTAEFGSPSTLDNLLEINLDAANVLYNLQHCGTLKKLREHFGRLGQGKADAIDTALDFILDMSVALGGGYHPDDAIADYVYVDRAAPDTPTKTFDAKVAKVLQTMHDESRGVLNAHDLDVCEVALVAMQALERLSYHRSLMKASERDAVHNPKMTAKT